MPDITITPSEDSSYLVSGLVRLTDGTHLTVDFDGTLAN